MGDHPYNPYIIFSLISYSPLASCREKKLWDSLSIVPVDAKIAGEPVAGSRIGFRAWFDGLAVKLVSGFQMKNPIVPLK